MDSSLPERNIALAGILVIALIFSLLHQGIGSLLIGIWLFYACRRLARKFIHIKEHFEHGCLNPAQVVSVNPYLIAVYADLSTSRKADWPALKILPQPLQRSHGARLQVGDRLATVFLYSGSRRQAHWSDFYPIAAHCVTDNPDEIHHAMTRLDSETQEGLAQLEHSLAQMPVHDEPGLCWMPAPEKPHRPSLPHVSD